MSKYPSHQLLISLCFYRREGSLLSLAQTSHFGKYLDAMCPMVQSLVPANVLCIFDVLSSLFGPSRSVSSEIILDCFLSNIDLSSLLDQIFLLPKDRATCVDCFQAAVYGTAAREGNKALRFW